MKKNKGITIHLPGFKLSPEQQEDLRRIEHRKNVTGPCTCGEPEECRCDLCCGPACNEALGFCCECFDAAAT